MGLTAFKKRIHGEGRTTVRIVNHRYPWLNRIQPVLRAQGNGFTTKAVRPDGSEVESWIYWPKAALASVSGNTCVLLNANDGEPWCEVTILEGEGT